MDRWWQACLYEHTRMKSLLVNDRTATILAIVTPILFKPKEISVAKCPLGHIVLFAYAHSTQANVLTCQSKIKTPNFCCFYIWQI